MFQLPFILHDELSKLLPALNSGIRRRGVIPIGGEIGTGKSRFLLHCQTSAVEYVQPDQIIAISLYDPDSQSLGSTRIASTSTLIAFSELYRALTWRELPTYVRNQRDWNDHPQRLYSDQQFLSLRYQVASRMRMIPIAVVIVDNAQFADQKLIKNLLHLRSLLDGNLAIVLCGRTAQHSTTTQLFARTLGSVDEAVRLQTEYLQIDRCKPQYFMDHIIQPCFDGLQSDFNAEVKRQQGQIAMKWWRWTRGDWYLIELVMQLFDEELSSDKRRIMTMDIVERLQQRLERRPKISTSKTPKAVEPSAPLPEDAPPTPRTASVEGENPIE
jgi:hypothetical protein